MKLNFELCKKCEDDLKWFENDGNLLFFGCLHCGDFIFDQTEYRLEKEDTFIYMEKITKKQWEDIKRMNVVEIKGNFNKCPYQLEHFVDSEE